MAAELSNDELPALFWDSVPENAEEHPDYIAMQALAEESTLEERAENFKEQGNNKLRVGAQAKSKVMLREAIDFYSRGICLNCSDRNLQSVLFSNRAHVESILGNWRKVLDDSIAAIELDPTNIKAHFRGARAASKLGEVDKAAELCGLGLGLDPDSKDLMQLQEDVQQRRQILEEQRRREEASYRARHEPAEKLADAIVKAGYRMTQAQVKVGHRKPHVDEAGLMHWPVLLTYPETMQQDVIEDFCVGDYISDHLDVMFDEEAPPLEWDTGREYVRQVVELYYLSHAGQQLSREEMVATFAGEGLDLTDNEGPSKYGSNAARWVRVDEKSTLDEVLRRPDFLVPGAPLFFVVARGTEYRDRFLAGTAK